MIGSKGHSQETAEPGFEPRLPQGPRGGQLPLLLFIVCRSVAALHFSLPKQQLHPEVALASSKLLTSPPPPICERDS